MKRIITILFIMCLCATYAEAQTIRLGERIPAINVDSELGRELELVTKQYVCLIFAHPESHPCIEALEQFDATMPDIDADMEVVVLLCEPRGSEAMLPCSNNYTLAFDNNHRTFQAFNIDYVPFGVIYETHRSRTLWFGPIEQLNAQTLTRILQ